jgi:hypothetical protein
MDCCWLPLCFCFFVFAFCGLLFWIWDVSSSSFVTDIPGPLSPPRQLGVKWPSWIGCVLLYRRNLHCVFSFSCQARFRSAPSPTLSLSFFFLCISSLEGKPPSQQTLRRYVGGSPDRTLAELNTLCIIDSAGSKTKLQDESEERDYDSKLLQGRSLADCRSCKKNRSND